MLLRIIMSKTKEYVCYSVQRVILSITMSAVRVAVKLWIDFLVWFDVSTDAQLRKSIACDLIPNFRWFSHSLKTTAHPLIDKANFAGVHKFS